MSEENTVYNVAVDGANRPINPCSLLEFSHVDFEHPSHVDVYTACARSGLSSAKLADFLGSNSRNVRRWKSGEIKKMPYAAWRLLLCLIGAIEIKFVD